MSLLQSYLLSQFLLFTLVLTRVSGLVMTAPVFGSQTIPLRIRALFAVAISLLVTPLYVGGRVEYPGTMLHFLVYLGGELLVGLVLGLGIMILFSGVQVAGQIVGQLSGTALASVFNPALDSESPIYAQVMYLVTLAVFVLIGGHRMVMASLLDTFEAVPPGQSFVNASVVDSLTTVIAQSFLLGIRAAAPVMTALLLSTLIMGLVSRTLPQLNILAVGFGLNSMVLMGGLMLSLGAIAWIFQQQVEPTLELLTDSLTSGNSS